MSTHDGYWLESWMQEFDIASKDDYFKAIGSPTVVKTLFEAIPDGHGDHLPKFDPYTVMAGRSLDLSASFHLTCFGCLSSELETVVTRSSHYFDSIAVSGPIPDQVGLALQHPNKSKREKALKDLYEHVALISYINEIGLRHKFQFVAKPSHYCPDCYAKAARDAGMTFYDDHEQRKVIVDQIVSTSQFQTIRNRSGNWTAKVTGPMVAGGPWVKEFGRTRPTRAQVAESAFFSLAHPSVQDFISSRRYKLPVIDMSEIDWTEGVKDQTDLSKAQAIALRVELPMLANVNLRDFAQLEQGEKSSFTKFQAAARKAVHEAIKRHESASPEVIAQAVVEEYIAPELADIEQKVKAAKRSLAKKAAASVVVGTTLTSIGLATAMPLITTAGIAAAATWLPQLYKFYDDAAGAESSELYFLWRLSRISHGSES